MDKVQRNGLEEVLLDKEDDKGYKDNPQYLISQPKDRKKEIEVS